MKGQNRGGTGRPEQHVTRQPAVTGPVDPSLGRVVRAPKPPPTVIGGAPRRTNGKQRGRS